jgi:hypothetical protein
MMTLLNIESCSLNIEYFLRKFSIFSAQSMSFSQTVGGDAQPQQETSLDIECYSLNIEYF